MCAKCEVCDFPCETLARSSYFGLPPGAGRDPEGKTHAYIYDRVFALGNVLSSLTIIYLHAYACTICTLIHPGVHTRTLTLALTLLLAPNTHISKQVDEPAPPQVRAALVVRAQQSVCVARLRVSHLWYYRRIPLIL